MSRYNMTPFERGTLTMKPIQEFIADIMENFDLSKADAMAQYKRIKRDDVWLNDLYQVNISHDTQHGFPFGLTHLSIKRLDKAPIHDWRHLQQIKNMLCGPEREAIEIYPAESRRVDLANQYHLWVFEAGVSVPCGMGDRAIYGYHAC